MRTCWVWSQQVEVQDGCGRCTWRGGRRCSASTEPYRMRLCPQAATSREVRHLVAGEGGGEPGSSPPQPGADGRHVEGPREPAQQGPQEVQDAFGFTLEVSPEQAAILERCRARQEHVRAKWQAAARGPDGLPPPDVLKKLCRKVCGGHWGRGGAPARSKCEVPPAVQNTTWAGSYICMTCLQHAGW